MKKFIILSIVVVGIVAFFSDLFTFAQGKREVSGSIYDFKMMSIEGKLIDFSQYKGKNLLIVNTASKCGYTPQFADLEKLHKQYGDQVTILGFPANNFFRQDPGSNHEIAEFCQRNYGVTFQMFEKISVKGKDKHPLYQWLEAKSGHVPSWNFCKFLINKNGDVVGYYPSKVNPLDKEIVDRVSH